MFTLRSVGIDIGSSTSHLVFSRLTLRREGASLSARFRVTDRRVLHRSPILLTPYIEGTLIDTDKIIDFVHRAYREAGFTPEDIDTGAVVITGEALKKENARPIAEFFAKDSGKFVCASAGPNHEALLAAHGSGAVALSRETSTTVLNVDIGGGTTKLTLVKRGAVVQTVAVSIGARLIAVDDRGAAVRVEEPARIIMNVAGHNLALGRRLIEREREDFAATMANVLFELIGGSEPSALTRALLLTPTLTAYRGIDEIDHLVFSGGVSEYIYGRERTAYHDLGPLLAKHVRRRLDGLGRPGLLREPAEGIRATVIGAGEYTVQASGSTGYLSTIDVLPAFGLKVVQLDAVNGGDVEAAAMRALKLFDYDCFVPGLAFALSLSEPPSYTSLRGVAEGIAAVLRTANDAAAPLYLMLDVDVAKSLGSILKEELCIPREVVALDGIDVGDLDYVDIGRPLGLSESVPVTVKSLLFPT